MVRVVLTSAVGVAKASWTGPRAMTSTPWGTGGGASWPRMSFDTNSQQVRSTKPPTATNRATMQGPPEESGTTGRCGSVNGRCVPWRRVAGANYYPEGSRLSRATAVKGAKQGKRRAPGKDTCSAALSLGALTRPGPLAMEGPPTRRPLGRGRVVGQDANPVELA